MTGRINAVTVIVSVTTTAIAGTTAVVTVAKEETVSHVKEERVRGMKMQTVSPAATGRKDRRAVIPPQMAQKTETPKVTD